MPPGLSTPTRPAVELSSPRGEFATRGGAERGEVGISLATKLAPPAIRSSELVDRAALLDVLSAEPYRKLTLLSAPAGWGKTTLLAQWVRSGGDHHQFAWLTLDASDNDPARFWTCTIAALDKVSPGVGTRALELLRLGTDHLQVVVPTLLNELAANADPVVLILDDYNTVVNTTVHEQVAFVIERMPATLRLVVATRSDPLLPVARLRGRGELLEIRTDALRFLVGEAARLLTLVLGLDLTCAEVEMLFRRTEGWAAGLYLAGLSLAGRSDATAFLQTFAGDNRHIVDYLIAEVLDGQPPQRRDFLLRTSLLRRLNGALCDAVLQSTGSAAVLAEIERDNLFLASLDDSRHWYRYHQLFAELLRTQLQLFEPELIPNLHQRAATWFIAAGFVDEAVHHLAADDDTTRLADLVATHWVTEFNRGRLSTISGWIDLLPHEAVSSDPRLSMARAWIALNFGDVDTAESWIETSKTALASDPARDDAMVARFDVLRAVYDFKIGSIGSALHRARDAIAGDVSNTLLGRPSAYCMYGSALYFCGDIPGAQAAYQRALQLAEQIGDHRARVYASGYLAVMAAEDDRLAEAEVFIGRATGKSRDFTPSEHFVGMMMSLLATAIILDRRGDLAAAVDMVDMAVASARHGAGVLEVAKALVVRAQTLEHGGEHATAEASRTDAAVVLRGLTDSTVAERLLAPAHRLADQATICAAAVDAPLTGKELEVLRLLATRLSRREIGERLYVTINTVKTHQRAIYRKLGVNTRAAAVRRAGQLGLV